MKPHYIIFHPDYQRQKKNVVATALIANVVKINWQGDIFVDKIGTACDSKNEDPFVFVNPWLYSYCHASQLRQTATNVKGYIQKGSWLIFASGQSADKDLLVIDTCFLVDCIHPWSHNPLNLPRQFQYLKNSSNLLWQRHFMFPFKGEHSKVKNTYTAELWNNLSEEYSFLPYNSIGELISFSISDLSTALAKKIRSKNKGKYPVDLTTDEIQEILKVINELAHIKVLRDIR